MGTDIAQDVLSKLFQQVIGEDVANLALICQWCTDKYETLRDLLRSTMMTLHLR